MPHPIAPIFAQACAQECDDDFVLGEPLPALEQLGRLEHVGDLAQWWWFNPSGHTMCGLRVWDSPATNQRLLGVAQWHHLAPSVVIYAAGSLAELSLSEALARTVSGVFEQHACDGDHPILPTLPSGVDLRQVESLIPVVWSALRTAFCNAAGTQSERCIRTTTYAMLAKPVDPRGRANLETKIGMLDAAEDLRKLAHLSGSTSRVDAFLDSLDELRKAREQWSTDTRASRDDVAQWWQLVTAQDHLNAERALIC
jgi:hypothetical protein